MSNKLPLISVCICTYKRPELLHQLLISLVAQRHSNFSFEIVVVDNDKKGSAKFVIEEFLTSHTDIIFLYSIEPQQGISYARNRSVAMAAGDYLAFIDDDETASPTWLSDLYVCLISTNADAALGPVLPVLPSASKEWVKKSGLFERPRYADQSKIGSGDGKTGNALVKAHWCKQRAPHCFKLSMAGSGGEDHDFFKWLESNGGTMVWSDKATVSEIVPLARQSISFILERRFRASVTYWRGVNETRPMFRALIDAAIGASGGVACLLLGALLYPVGLAGAIRWWVKAMNGFGRVVALSEIQLVGYGIAE